MKWNFTDLFPVYNRVTVPRGFLLRVTKTNNNI